MAINIAFDGEFDCNFQTLVFTVVYYGEEQSNLPTQVSFPAKWQDMSEDVTFLIHHKPPNGHVDNVKVFESEDAAEEFLDTLVIGTCDGGIGDEWSMCSLQDAIELWKRREAQI